MASLGDPPGGTVSGIAYSVSADNSTVAGSSMSATGQEAFIWSMTHGMRSLQSVLVEEHGLGSALAGWRLNAAFGITPDGLTIVGDGINPQGQTEAWHAVIPEPATLVLLAPGIAATFRAGWRGRHRRLYLKHSRPRL